MRQRQEKALGPYGPHGGRYRVIIEYADGSRTYARESEDGPAGFTSWEAAQAYKDAYNGEVTGHSVAAAVDLYLEHCRTRGLRSVTTIGYRLRGLLRTTSDRPLRQLTPAAARELFKARAPKVSGDTQVGELAAARQACEWWREQGWIGGDPFAGIQPTKPRSRARRKQQHRIDEARSFRDVAVAAGEAGLAAAMALLMDLRASEIIERTVRDVDDDGAVLVIEDAKTPAGERRLEIPEELREPIAARCAGRKPGDRLFPGRSRHWVGYHVRRLCDLAKVPVIGPHGLRRTHSSISVREVSIEHVAAALGHASPAVTRRHYLAPGAEQTGRSRAALRVLQGGLKRVGSRR